MEGNSNSVPEAALGDFVADVNELTRAYEAVLDMSFNITSGIQMFPLGNFYFPGENLSDRECYCANISRPQYSNEIVPLLQDANILMQNIKQKTDRLSELVNVYIESLRALNSQIDAMFSQALPLIKSNKLGEFSNINPNIIDVNFIESLIGTMSYEEYKGFVLGIENYYDREIASNKMMLDGYNELLEPVLMFLTGQGADISRELINYDVNIASGLMTEESKAAYIELIDSQVSEIFGNIGINTYEDLIQYRQTLDYYIGVTNLLINRDKEQKGSAEYDYLMFLEDFQNYKDKYVVSTLPQEVEKDLKDLMIASKYNPDFAIVYNYLYDKNPEDAAKYKQAVQYQINDIQGQIMARDFLEWLDENDGRLDKVGGVYNELAVGVKGILDGLNSFGAGVTYTCEAVSNLFQKYILNNEISENRIMSVDEYARNYILQALLSEKDKEKMGLIVENNDSYVSTSPYQILDYTKDYSGILLSNNYQLNQGIGNMLPSILLSTINPVAGSAVLGVSSGGNSYHGAMVDGNSLERSVFYGILSGSTEAITEKFLGGLPGLSETKVTNVSTWLKAIAKEGNEEVYQDFMDMAFRALTLGEEIKIPSTMEEFKDLLKTERDTWLYGAVTAGVLQSSSMALSGIKSLNTNNKSISKVNNESLDIKKDNSSIIDILISKLKNNSNKTLILKDTHDFYSNFYKFYKEERNGITFVSDTKEKLNILLDQYEDAKMNSNIITRLYLKYLENNDLKITNIKFDGYTTAFQSNGLVVLEKKGSESTFFHETSHFRDWLINHFYISPSIYQDSLDKIRNDPKKANYFMKFNLDVLKAFPNLVAEELNISNRSEYSDALMAVSDIFDAIYKGKIADFYIGPSGHGSDYYKHRGNDAIEIFAQVGSLINTEYSDLLYKYFPKDFADSLIKGYYNSVFYKGGILESDFSDVDDINSIIHFAITGDLSRVKKARLTNILESNPNDAILAAFSPNVAYNYLDQLRIIDPSLTNQLEKYAKTGDFKEIKNSSAIVYLNYLKADILKLYLTDNFGKLHTNFNQNKLGTISNEFKNIIETNNNDEYIKTNIEEFKIEFLNNLNNGKLYTKKVNGITFASSTNESLNELVNAYNYIKQSGNSLMKLYLKTLENSYTFLTNIKIDGTSAFQVGNIIDIADTKELGNFLGKTDNFKAIRDTYISPTIYEDTLTKIKEDKNLWNYFVNFNQQGNNMDFETYLKISFIYNAIYDGKLVDNSQLNYNGLTLLGSFNSEYFKYNNSATEIYRIVSDLVANEKSDVLYRFFPQYFAEPLLNGYYNTPLYTPYNFENNLNSIFDVNDVLNYAETGDLSVVNNKSALANMLKYNLDDALVAITSPNVVFRYFDELCKIDSLLMSQLVEYVNTKNLNVVKNDYAQKYLPNIGIDVLKIYVNYNKNL